MALTRPKMTPMAADAKNMRQNRPTPVMNAMPPLTCAISGLDSCMNVLQPAIPD